jgi:hypothetical protein
MRYAVGIALFFSGMAFSQSSPNHFQLPDKLIDPHVKPKVLTGLLNGPQPLIQIAPRAPACAIPLLNTLPANSKADFKIQVIKPPAESLDHMPVVHSMPACST